MSTTRSFKGVVGGVTYDDPTLFETAARALGFRRGQARSPKWKVGTAIAVTMDDGTKVEGQVWSKADVRNYVWVALNNGTYVAVFTPFQSVHKVPSGDRVGKVAA